jgi:hypothetical protein
LLIYAVPSTYDICRQHPCEYASIKEITDHGK